MAGQRTSYQEKTTNNMPQQKYSTNEWREVSSDNNHDDFNDYDNGRKCGRGGGGGMRRTRW